MKKRAVDIFAVDSALGAPDGGVAGGPEALRAAGLLSAVHRSGRSARWRKRLAPPEGTRWTSLLALCESLAEKVEASLKAGRMPLVVGGDHSIAVGTWTGAARVLGSMGLIWIDAHLDSHNPFSSHSGNPHGMPLAALMGVGQRGWASESVDPHRVCVVGARDWEPEEAARLARFGVRVFDRAEIEKRGLVAVMKEARQIAGAGLRNYGISLDLDVFDPGEAPGVNSPVRDGISAERGMSVLRGLADDPLCRAVELVEYDPTRDSDRRTVRLALQLVEALFAPSAQDMMDGENTFGARNYAPLPVVLSRGAGCHVWDVDGRQYLDMMSAYSAVSFGHCHPRLTQALTEQAQRLAVTSRAYYNDRLPAFLQRLTNMAGYDRALPVNTGLEAVETALKAARKWGHKIKGIPTGRAEIIACDGNFHGRSIAIVGLSSDAQYRDGFGPFPRGLKRIPFGDAQALAAAITPHTVAFIVEPIQGEGGIVMPPQGYLAACAEICRMRNVLLICDEVQTGLGRTGKLFAHQHEGIRPDGLILGKALGGGLLPVSAFLADDAVMQVFTPGDHGSTFGGNALAAAVALEALDLLEEEQLVERSAKLGDWLLKRLRRIASPAIREIRGRGLFIGIELDPRIVAARTVCERLMARGILSKDTHHTVIRLAPPLVVTQEELAWVADEIEGVLDRFGNG